MNTKLQQQLFDTFSWYSNKCRNQGIRCGDGWFNIIDDMNFKIDDYIMKFKINNFFIDRVEERFGSLKITTNKRDEVLNRYIEDAEKISLITCELCGNPGNAYNINGIAIIACPKCYYGKEEFKRMLEDGRLFYEN